MARLASESVQRTKTWAYIVEGDVVVITHVAME